ncbi:hypothetical protein JW707_03020 [Candidatus Woesearchaeota archaeon]|nr:hypothetical protein [Candidatus Woesearchaeota archaeon]
MEGDKEAFSAPRFFVLTLTISMIVFFLGVLFVMFLWISKLDGTLRLVSYAVLMCAVALFAISIIGICSFMVTSKKPAKK